jgi:energy-coupling factor transport system ATP-binding protein
MLKGGAQMALLAQNLYFTYPKGKKAVLSDFTASFLPGELAALTGANGCGKTTLAKILLGILQPQKGLVQLDGRNIAGLTLAEVGRSVGYVMQNPAQQLFCTSVEKEMDYGLLNLGLSAEERDKRINYYLEYFQLNQHRKSFPFHLSLGEKQRLLLAAVLAMKPRYLLLDEPTAYLDVYRRRLLGEYLQKIRTELTCGIIVVSHDRDFVCKYCQREIVMQNGGTVRNYVDRQGAFQREKVQPRGKA